MAFADPVLWATTDPVLWATTGTVSTAVATIAGLGFRALREHIRAKCRLASLREALRDTRPADRAGILRALAELESAPGDPPARPPRRTVTAAPVRQRRSTT